MDRSNKVQALRASGLFDACQDPAAIERFAPHAAMVRYDSGSLVPITGSWPDFHVLVEGCIQVVHYAESGREVRLSEFTDGQVFGGFDLMGDSRITVHLIAKLDTWAVRFPDWTLYDAARVDPDLGVELLRRAASLIIHLARSLVELTVERARDRVRLTLVRQAQRNMVDAHTGVIEVAPTHADLAAQVGSHREEITREMSYLRKRKLIERSGRRLLVRVGAIKNLYERERQNDR